MACPGFESTPARPFEHGWGHIDADNLSGWSDHLRGDQTIHASTTTDIDDPLAGLEVADAKGVARAGERRDRACGKPFQPAIAVAKHAGEWTTGVEVIASPRVARHRCVFLLDGLAQLSQVKARFCRETVTHGDLLL